MEFAIALLDGLEMIAASVNALTINMELTARKRVNAKLTAPSCVILTMENVSANQAGAARRATDHVRS